MSGNKSVLKSKLDPLDDSPEWTQEMFETADLYRGGVLVRRGRPLGSGSRELVSLRLDKETLAAFKATGPGWQSRINDVLKHSAKRLVRK